MLEMFGLTKKKLFVTRYPSRSDAPRTNKEIEKLFEFPSRTTPNELLTIPDSQSNYVCVSHGASGFGWLTDHGVGVLTAGTPEIWSILPILEEGLN